MKSLQLVICLACRMPIVSSGCGCPASGKIGILRFASSSLIRSRYLLHDRDSKYGAAFRQVIKAGSIKTMVLPAQKTQFERLCRPLGEIDQIGVSVETVRRRFLAVGALREYEQHYRQERNHQGKYNLLLFLSPPFPTSISKY